MNNPRATTMNDPPTLTEIERKFLLRSRPPPLEAFRFHEIAQGYITNSDEPTEVRLRQRDRDHFLTVKRGAGLTRTEVEIPLKKEQFKALWPLTLKMRVVKKRFLIPHAGRTIEVDLFEGPLDGLTLAEIEFPSETASETFDLPPWLGREVTDVPGFSNRNLALHGLPDGAADAPRFPGLATGIYRQSGVIPFKGGGGDLRVLVISSRHASAWVIPKGIVAPGLSPADSAIHEAWEEAGVRGPIIGDRIGSYTYEKWGGTCTVSVFAMEVTTESDTWPEDFRERRWVSAYEAAALIAIPALREIVISLPSGPVATLPSKGSMHGRTG